MGGIGAALLSGGLLTSKTTRTQLGGDVPVPVAINNSGLSAAVLSRDSRTLSLKVTTDGDTAVSDRILAVKRGFPKGTVYEAHAATLSLNTARDGQAVQFDFDPNSHEGNTPWYYVLYAVPRHTGAGWAEYEYVQETDPLVGAGDITREARLEQPEYSPSFGDARTESEGTFTNTYRWYDRGHLNGRSSNVWMFEQEVGKSEYHSARANTDSLMETYDAAMDDDALRAFSTGLFDAEEVGGTKSLKDLSEKEQLIAIVRFVQSRIYSTDRGTKDEREYYRTPIETVVDFTGDCEDTTFLLAGLLENEPFNYRTSLLFTPGHILVGLHLDDCPLSTDDCHEVRIRGEPFTPVETIHTDPIGKKTDKPILVSYYDGDWQLHNTDTIPETVASYLP